MTGPSPDLDAFGSEVAAWIEQHCPAELRTPLGAGESLPVEGRSLADRSPAERGWLAAMAGRGWTAPTWPREYGGGGLSAEQAGVLAQVLKRLGARPPMSRLNTAMQMLGPVLLEYADEEQKRRFLPSIARGEVRWCQGYSEPEAGSDLASLRTRAERDGDSFRVNGHKIWSSYAHVSDWMFALVRTDPADKHRGISFLLIDMTSAGIRVDPITLISGRSDFCEVLLTDVLVPADQLVGEPGAGWSIAKRLLQHERGMLGSAGGGLSGGGGSGKRSLEQLVRERCANVDAGAERARIRDEYAGHLVELRAMQAMARRHATDPGASRAAASIGKLVGTELNQRRQDLIADLLGLDGLVWSGEPLDPDSDGRVRQWLRSRGNSIEGGTSEVQLNIIAKLGLGLPPGASS